ncbi:MAG: homoserine kinase [Gammaproteobacteria bacterium]
MSVYTVIERRELELFLESFPLGNLKDYEGIIDGIENTNYFVTTATGQFVLTVFESTPKSELPYFLGLMAHLAERGIVSAHPIADGNGDYLQQIKGKPAALVRRLRGENVENPGPRRCAAIGAEMAALHLAGQGFSGRRANDRGLEWQAETGERVLPYLSSTDRSLLQVTLSEQVDIDSSALPRGVIHADLFRDNALFIGNELTGIVDFYYAHNSFLIYDLAVTIADWCFDGCGGFDDFAAQELVRAYDRIRPISELERASWPHFVRSAGLRFWLSRLKGKFFPRKGSLTHIKNPESFRQVLIAGQDQTSMINTLLQ